ncbi:hypothetical protein [Litchfieldia salsa]|uniref:ATP-dependent Lon protease n=1 Tax=Litchfieldia salsa TaxID=930152 RepID=A0A1H0X0I4_9BACI|nr:hypothetical protein [Litchfieldia salsa]SDP96478.1 hypothetical protein SAMN05216565_12158 [Litchfieldia salsa]
MYLLISIILSAILGFVLLMMGPLVGGIVAFGIVVGCILRGLYLLNDLHKRISNISAKEDIVQKAYREYLDEKNY